MTTKISTYDELQEIPNAPSVHYELTDDIDASGKSWDPNAFSVPFTGVLDGNGHTIKGLTVSQEFAPATFVPFCDGAEIRNLTLENATFSGASAAGLLIDAAAARIDDVHIVDSDIEGGDFASGFIATSYGKSVVSNCSVRGTTVTTGAASPAGGFIGTAGDPSSPDGGLTRIEGCLFDGTLTSSATATTYQGGFVGKVVDAELHRCSAKGTIDSGAEGVGGFAGYTENLITCCSWEGDIYADGGATGGFVNEISGSDTEVQSCYARGGELVGGNNTGGFVNHHNGSDIVNCYTAMASRVTEGSSPYAAFGVTMEGMVDDSAWDTGETTMPDGVHEYTYTTDGGGVVEVETDQLQGTTLWSRIVNEWNLDWRWTPMPNGYIELQHNLTIPIDSLEDLDNIRDLPGADYELVNDIDASPTQEWNENAFGTPQGFVPIPEFRGTLDGNGYEITGFYIDRDETSGVGLFSLLYGYVRDLSFTDAYIRGADGVGPVAGEIDWEYGILPRVRNIVSEAELESSALNDTGHDVGGIVGWTSSPAHIIQCHADVTIDAGAGNVGGIVGYVTSTLTGTTRSKLAECSSAGSITGGGSGVGGVLGWLSGDADYAGWEISDCYSTADVSSTADSTATAGGVVGTFYGASSDLLRVFAAGTVSSDTGDAGGVVGYLWEDDGTPQINADASVYWDGEASGVSVAVGTGAALTDATELTTAEMTGPDAVDNLSGFDFGTVWVQEYEDYPSLTAFSLGSALYSGYVTDVDGVPVEGAAVETDSLTLWARTDADGYYEIVGPVVIDFDLVSLSGAVSKEAVPNTEVNFQFGGIKVILKDPATGRPLEDIIIQISEYYARTDSQGEVRIPTIPPQTRYDVVAFEQFERRAWVAEEGDLFVVDFTDELEEIPEGPSFGDVAILEFEVIDERSNPIHETTATVDVFGAITESNRDGKLMVPVPTHGDLDPTIIFADGDPRYRTRRLDVDPGEDPDIGNLILREKTHSVNH